MILTLLQDRLEYAYRLDAAHPSVGHVFRYGRLVPRHHLFYPHILCIYISNDIFNAHCLELAEIFHRYWQVSAFLEEEEEDTPTPSGQQT